MRIRQLLPMLKRLNQVRTVLVSLTTTGSSRIETSYYRSAMTSGFVHDAIRGADGTDPVIATRQPEIATFAGGCFWGVEHIFLKHYPPSQNKGILKTTVGYTGGKDSNPNYRSVCDGRTNHAEAVRIEFDPSIVTYGELVEFFYRTHDPTTSNRQGADTGTQYRSAIFTHSSEQANTAKRVTEEVQAKHFTPKGKRIVTDVVEAGPWYEGEEYHQLYLFKNPRGYQCPTHTLHW